MVSRATAVAISLLSLSLLLGGCSSPAERSYTLSSGDSIPENWIPGTTREVPGTFFVWLFRTEDCLTCQVMDYQMRRVQAQFGEAIPLVAVHVGVEADSTVPQAFFARTRLRVSRQVMITPREYERNFTKAEVPSIYLVHNGRIAWSSSDRSNAQKGTVRLDTLLRIVQRPNRDSATAQASASRPEVK